jgi:hypothetical protein
MVSHAEQTSDDQALADDQEHGARVQSPLQGEICTVHNNNGLLCSDPRIFNKIFICFCFRHRISKKSKPDRLGLDPARQLTIARKLWPRLRYTTRAHTE